MVSQQEMTVKDQLEELYKERYQRTAREIERERATLQAFQPEVFVQYCALAQRAPYCGDYPEYHRVTAVLEEMGLIYLLGCIEEDD